MRKTDLINNVRDTEHLEDFLNDYIFYNLEESFTKEEFEEALNEKIWNNIFEYADWQVDIYNSQLTKWLTENSSVFDDYINEFWYNSDKTIYENIQMAQFLEIERELEEELKEFAEEMGIDLEI